MLFVESKGVFARAWLYFGYSLVIEFSICAQKIKL